MTLRLLKFKSGIVKDITEYAAGKNGPFYVDGNLVRFVNGYPEKMGGWQQEDYFRTTATGTTTTAQGKPKKIIFWRSTNDGADRIALGTSSHLYILKADVLYDITPLRKTSSSLSNPLATTDGSTTVTVTDTAHGATTGDYVVLDSASAIGGISADTLNRIEGYEITKITDNSYSFVSPDAATSTVASGGGTMNIKYLIGNAESIGIESSDPALGWGTGAWGDST